MGVPGLEPGFLVLLFVGLNLSYFGKASVVDMPGGVQLDLWSLLLSNDPLSITELAWQNFSIWLSVYSLSYLLLYVKPQRSLFHPFKLNGNYPPFNLVLLEIGRSARGVAICTLYSAIINSLHMTGSLPSSLTPDMFLPDEDGNLSMNVQVFGALIIYLWGDFHFYWTHRLLHTRWLYRSVHMIHHQSFNPDPFSGLSMHWVESAIYFSSAPMLAPVAPLWMFRVISISLILLPLSGHWGMGKWDIESSCNHYIHHAKFNWNYGSSTLWDHIMGTNYCEENVKRRRNQQKAAVNQAALVDCTISEAYEDYGQNKKKQY